MRGVAGDGTADDGTASDVGVIVVAAGSGSRLGLGQPKALVALAAQRSILEHALDAVFGMAEPAEVVVVAPPNELERARTLCELVAGAALPYLSVVPGGATRQESVRAGLAVLSAEVRVVLVHDAARAFTPSAQFDLVASSVVDSRAGVVPGLPVSDTIKRADASGRVLDTVDRSQLVAVQTPQGFPRHELERAYGAATEEYTDDAALFAAAGGDVSVVGGDALAFKITTAWDLRRAESLLAETVAHDATLETRTGIGVDVHAFDAASPLWLGALHWPGEQGLSGHSDGDALSHAICDSLLSAARLGDIGGRFGTADARFAGAHGDVFIRETVNLVTGAGFTIGNVAVQVIAEHPKLSARRIELEARLGELVGAPVSVSATTSDGLGFPGRGDGVAVISTALVTLAPFKLAQ